MIGSKNLSVLELTSAINKNLNGKGGGKEFFTQGKFNATKEDAIIFFDNLQ